MIRNELKKLMDAKGITPYEFWKTTNLHKATAYRLYKDEKYIPGREVMETIAKKYGWVPAWYITWVPDEIADVVDRAPVGTV